MAEADVGYFLNAVEGVGGANGNVSRREHRQIVLVVAAGIDLDGLAYLFLNVLAKRGEHRRLRRARCLEFKIRRARFAGLKATRPASLCNRAKFVGTLDRTANDKLVPIRDSVPMFSSKDLLYWIVPETHLRSPTLDAVADEDDFAEIRPQMWPPDGECVG